MPITLLCRVVMRKSGGGYEDEGAEGPGGHHSGAVDDGGTDHAVEVSAEEIAQGRWRRRRGEGGR